MTFESKEALERYFEQHPDLVELEVDNYPLEQLPAIPDSVKHLRFTNCPLLTSLPSSSSRSLCTVAVNNCPRLCVIPISAHPEPLLLTDNYPV